MDQPITLEERKAGWAETFVEFKADTLDVAAAEGNENTLDVTIESHIWAMIQRGQHVEFSLFFDTDFHIFAATVIQAAKSYHYDNLKQVEIVFNILRAKEIGTVARPVVDPSTGQQKLVPCTTTTGARVLSDLPFLVEDIQEEWLKNSLTMDSVSRANFIAFIGRLVSVGLSDSLAICGLRLCHDTLETPRRLRASDAGQDVPVLELLNALGAWLITDYHKVHTLSRKGMQFDTDLAVPGELARNAGITTNGFSVQRWRYWIVRLREIRSQLSVDEKKALKIDHALERMSSDTVNVFLG
jgi:hypothetical protein